MNTVVTSKEDILEASRELIRRQGWAAVNIRSVAAACGVSVGSIYNYFGSKAELAGAAVESVWQEIFDCPAGGDAFRDTCACVSWMYSRMEYGGRRYPGFLPFIRWAFCSRTGRRAAAGCTAPGSTFWTGCARCWNGTLRSAPARSARRSRLKPWPRYCST